MGGAAGEGPGGPSRPAAPGEGGRPQGGVGRGEGGWPCRGRVRGRRDRPRPGSRRAGGSGCPLSPSSAPSRRRLLPSHRRVLRARVRNVTGGSRGEGQTRAAGREHGCTRPPSPGGGEGDRAEKEGVRGEAGQGQARGPARKARALGPRGRRRCHRQDAPRPGRPPASSSPPDSPLPSLHLVTISTAPQHMPLCCPQPLCCWESQIPKCDKRSVAEALRSRHALGTTGHPPASEIDWVVSAQQSPGFYPPKVPHSPVHYSLPHPLLHPGRDPILRWRKRKLRVGGEGRVGVGKSAGKEGGARKVSECLMWFAPRRSPLPRAPRGAPQTHGH